MTYEWFKGMLFTKGSQLRRIVNSSALILDENRRINDRLWELERKMEQEESSREKIHQLLIVMNQKLDNVVKR